MKALIIILVIFPLLIVSCKARETDKKAADKIATELTAADLQERGGLLYEERHYQTAVATYEKVLKAAPDSLDTQKKLSDAYYKLSEIEKDLGNEDLSKKYMSRSIELGHQ